MQELVLSFHHTDPGDQPQVAKLRSKCPWLLSHFMDPHKETLLD